VSIFSLDLVVEDASRKDISLSLSLVSSLPFIISVFLYLSPSLYPCSTGRNERPERERKRERARVSERERE
jgi:hypothetical protein